MTTAQASHHFVDKATYLASESYTLDPNGVIFGDDEDRWTYTYKVGQTYYGFKQYTEYIPGTLPLVISVPHGGLMHPTEIPNRKSGCFEPDFYTQTLARYIYQAAVDLGATIPSSAPESTSESESNSDEKSSSKSVLATPHLIINHLHRIKLDANRNREQGANGNALAERAWSDYHTFIDVAKFTALKTFPRCIILDLHGQSHDVTRIQLGYVLNKQHLAHDRVTFHNQSIIQHSSVRELAGYTAEKYGRTEQSIIQTKEHGVIVERFVGRQHTLLNADSHELIRGKQSLGYLLQAAGLPAVPSPAHPDPNTTNLTYFNGGFTTWRHGSLHGGACSAIQLETNYDGVRDSHANQRTFARKFIQCIYTYCDWFVGTELLKNDAHTDIPSSHSKATLLN